VKRVPVARVERLLGLYRERYFDMNVRHFREAGPRSILSYSWVKGILRGAGLVGRGRKIERAARESTTIGIPSRQGEA
jgi:hypothetical protein